MHLSSVLPVRALCQMEEIPVQVSREDFTATWQLRETQALLNWSQSQGNLLKAGHLLQWVREQPSGPWNELLVEALENYLLETNNEELPAGVFREWLAEWARDNRRRQHGLLLTSAHRAKGLEFDHVAILDGSWHTAGKGEDTDAPRRLYYVAMTRARKTLTLARCGNSNPFLRLLRSHPSVLVRQEPDRIPPAPVEMRQAYQRLSLRDVQLSFAGYKPPDHPVHRAIAGLSAGAPLRVRTDRNPWELTTVDVLKDGTIPERKALIRNFVEGIEVVGEEATLTYTVPMPSDGAMSESASVLDFVKSGPPPPTVDTTIFEMWLGRLSTHQGLSIPVV